MSTSRGFREMALSRSPRISFHRRTGTGASLLSAEENRKAVVTTLVSNVATQYFTLREFDAQLDIARQTLATRQESLDLTVSRRNYGIATQLDVRQAEQLVDTAGITISNLQQQIEQTENQIT